MADLPYSTIAVVGDDASDFLQAQLAADLARINGGLEPSHRHAGEHAQDEWPQSSLSAWCNPKGRVICLLRVARRKGGFTLALPTELAEEVVRRLTLFRFRAKVDFAVEAATKNQLGISGTFEEWRLDNLRSGVPEIGSQQSEEYTPHMLNLDLLDAVSVDKGCYPGQEIVARTHFRGATKRRTLLFQSSAPVAPGDKVSDGNRDVGSVLNAIGNELLAVVPIDRADAGLSVDGVTLRHKRLPYL